MMRKLLAACMAILLLSGAALHADSSLTVIAVSKPLSVNSESGFGSLLQGDEVGVAFESGADSDETAFRPETPSNPPVACRFFDEKSFNDAVSAAAAAFQGETGCLVGGILPHHLLASGMIASFWKTASLSDYDLIVIIGPDHKKIGLSEITTVSSPFATPFGDVPVDSNLAGALVSSNLAAEDPQVMENEYAVAAQMPFIRYYMPDTPVLPLLAYGNCEFDKLILLSGKILSEIGDKNVLFVASMDFSHYLPLEKADEMDVITEKAIRSFDYAAIGGMGNDNLDSRPSLLFLLETMSELNARSISKWAHSNSDVIAGKSTGYTTSYFDFGLYKPAGETESMVGNSGSSGEKGVTAGSELRIMATGDIMLGRGVEQRLENQGYDYTWPFLEVAGMLKQGDVVFGNLEQAITERTKSLRKQYVLKSGQDVLQGIKFAGFNLLSLANNHTMDFYSEGLTDTLNILEENDMAFAGAGNNLGEARKPAVISCKGMKIGLLAYSDMADTVYDGDPPTRFAASDEAPGVAPLIPANITEDVRKARDQVDLLIVSLHWGVEDSFDVTDEQVNLAHSIIDEGADMILGHHPHRFQGVEIYHGKPIAYSLGNFIFDQDDPENQESFILDFKWSTRTLVELSAIPVKTVGKIRVVPQTGPDAAAMLDRELRLSNNLGTECRILQDRLYFSLR